METVICMLQAVGISDVEARLITPWLKRSQKAFVKFLHMYITESNIAKNYPIARPQLIKVFNSMQDLMQNRILWAWAATWTLKNAIIADLKPKGYLLGICVNCALYTGCFCDYCDGAICTTCDDEFDTNGTHQCQLCIEATTQNTKTMSR